MRFLLVCGSAALFALLAACSSDSDGASPAGSGGSSSTGGKTGSGGRVGSGGAPGTGGYDPALAKECGVVVGTSECEICLAAQCCDADKACLGSSTCVTAFEEYQTCEKTAAMDDKSACFSKFNRTISADGGAAIHATLVTCIINDCSSCGPPAVF